MVQWVNKFFIGAISKLALRAIFTFHLQLREIVLVFVILREQRLARSFPTVAWAFRLNGMVRFTKHPKAFGAKGLKALGTTESRSYIAQLIAYHAHYMREDFLNLLGLQILDFRERNRVFVLI